MEQRLLNLKKAFFNLCDSFPAILDSQRRFVLSAIAMAENHGWS